MVLFPIQQFRFIPFPVAKVFYPYPIIAVIIIFASIIDDKNIYLGRSIYR